MKKILWVKFGWSELYRGGPVDGNFGWLNDHRGKKDEGRGHEAFNFMPAPDGTYYCYVPPQKKVHSPGNDDNTGWTVVCLAKNPKRKGIHIVGWYEDATLIGRSVRLPLGARPAATETKSWTYCIQSKSAFFIPAPQRTVPFSDPSVRQGKYSFLTGPDVSSSPGKRRVLALLQTRLSQFRGVAIHNPNEINLPDPELNPSDPLIGFGTPEHRKSVELAAEREVVAYYRSKGFNEERVAHLPCGFDYVFKKGRTVHRVEIKGTSAAEERFYITRNEHNHCSDPGWRLGMVTSALSEKPHVKMYDVGEFKAAFDLDPYVFIGTRIVVPEDVI